MPPTHRSRRHTRARELTVHAAILAAAIWLAVGGEVLSPGPTGRISGSQKGNDFVQFYVAGRLAGQGAFVDLVDPERFSRAQRPYFPKGEPLSFPPVYGPSVALFFAPFAALPYLAAYALWSALTLGLTFWSVAVCRRSCPPLVPWPWPTIAATAAFPPLGFLVLDGQLSAVGLAALALAVLALRQGSEIWAGAGVGLLAYKVSLFAPALAVCVVAGRPAMVTGAVLAAVAQLAVTVPLAGSHVVASHLANVSAYAQAPDLLARNPFMMASLRTFWSALLPAPAALAAFGVSAGAVVGAAGWAWRRTASPLDCVALLSVAIVLASPHLFLYDLILLVPAFVASAGRLVIARALFLRWCTWLAYFSPLTVVAAAATGVQFVTMLLALWLGALVRTLPRPAAAADDAVPLPSAK